jgi:hypothetical protein
MNLDQLLRDSAPDSAEMHRQADQKRPGVVARFHDAVPTTRRPRRGRRWAAGLAVAAATATAYVVVSPGGPAVSPAYAVTQQADGDVVVTLHRLEDSAGLEAALSEQGIDALVSFDPATTGFHAVPDSLFDELAADGGGPACYPEDLDGFASITQEGADWVLRIPADSVLQDREIAISTGSSGSLVAYFAGNRPGAICAVVAGG